MHDITTALDPEGPQKCNLHLTWSFSQETEKLPKLTNSLTNLRGHQFHAILQNTKPYLITC